ncbi:hypothetical protein CI109_104461 [Kwoniella shandongensis]|uniref:Uncharacterized protein n=1 Tax=Kwoniella shandongensis TaxID=1734106 RepID=A0A5M6BNS5_9TREE|nr:uncharacterized protein CI109_007311 [Kwoniella shandongensis]KAA5524363.1 hypothetical protein CI109_007311 [Kwoniella shandongensis]
MSVSEDREIPGTVRLFAETGELLRSEVELIPKPSHDPADPLNWSRTRKNIVLACVVFYTFASVLTVTVLYSIYVPLTEVTGLTLDQVLIGSGYSYWAIGFAVIVVQPVSIAIGKRPVIVILSLAGALLSI